MLQWMPLWMRYSVAIAAGALPLVITIRSFMRGDVERRGKVIAGLIVRLPIICLVSLIGIVSLFQLTTVQAVRAVLITVAGTGAATCFYQARRAAGRSSTKWFINIGALMSAAFVFVAFALRADSSAPRFRGGIFTSLLVASALALATTFVEAAHRSRTKADEAADQLGRRMVLLGVVVGAIALSVRLLLSAGVFLMSVCWWLFFMAVGAFVLIKTKYANWILAVGRTNVAARATLLPVCNRNTGPFNVGLLDG